MGYDGYTRPRRRYAGVQCIILYATDSNLGFLAQFMSPFVAFIISDNDNFFLFFFLREIGLRLIKYSVEEDDYDYYRCISFRRNDFFSFSHSQISFNLAYY